MRRALLVAVLVLVLPGLFWVMAGRDTGEAPVAARQPLLEEVDEVAAPDSIVGPTTEPELPRSLLVDEAFDLTGDGAPERIQLYVDAERGADGRLRWDDGQRWLLLVRAAGGYYPLFDEYVQIGHLQFWVAEEDGHTAPRVLLLRSAGAAVELRSYRFTERGGFSSSVEFSLTGNVVYTSPLAR